MNATATTAPNRSTRSPLRPVLRPRLSRNRIVIGLAKHAGMLSLLFVILYPVLWMIGASLRPGNETFTTLGLWAGDLTFDNYVEGWNAGSLSFGRYFLNSLVITGLCIVGNVVACSLAAFAFARLRFPYKRFMFALMLGTMLLPYHVTMVPQYVLFNELAWINTVLPLTVPKFLATDAFFVFLMVQFVRTLPRELDDAARLDGCGYVGIFGRIVLPLSIPAIGTTALFTFINTWNDFLGPLLYLNRPEMWTVAQGLNSFVDITTQSAYGQLFAMAALSIAPIVGFFLAAQRLLIEGIATSGLK
ncbi:carbohydrate ABC transporter permease [Ruania alba]|uniref:Carbohydrate ABC transporter membrane protein 2, CUT1 family n=1 Tax=Ruania alba TaxID=648782 RepID=A0A1H5MEH3_9MICO|nr:carbohydrate ABC transporter permease [Ruania alba]SEE87716.1 carbohydrate ABC transporter membrane protein 2, CUT1 family [Ruania alba]